MPPQADDSLLTENEQMKKRIGELQDLISTPENTIDEKNEELKLLQAQVDSLAKNEKDLSESLLAAKGDLEKKNVALTAERDKLKNDLAASNAERNKLKESIFRETATGVTGGCFIFKASLHTGYS